MYDIVKFITRIVKCSCFRHLSFFPRLIIELVKSMFAIVKRSPGCTRLAKTDSGPQRPTPRQHHKALEGLPAEKFHGHGGLTVVFAHFLHGTNHWLKVPESSVLSGI
jgi:hypothetical protein